MTTHSIVKNNRPSKSNIAHLITARIVAWFALAMIMGAGPQSVSYIVMGASVAAPSVTNPGPQTSAVTVEQGYAAAVLMAGPVGYWRLEDYSGTTATDWAATPHPGTISGGVSGGQVGALADGSVAMHFDGQVGTRIDIADGAALQFTEAVTVEVWAKTEQAYATGLLFEKTAGPSTPAYLLMQEGDMWRWRVAGTFGTMTRWTPVTAEDVGAWVHLVGTFDGQTTRLYKNGVLMHSEEAIGTLNAGPGSTRIGLLAVNAYAFPGGIDEVAVYGTALTPEAIAGHHDLRTLPSAVTVPISATDPDDDPLVYTAIGLPPGLLIHPLTGLITGNPGTLGTFSVTIAATDPGGLAAQETFTSAAVNDIETPRSS